MSIEVNDREVLGAFNAMLAVGVDPRPQLSLIGANLVASTRLRFRDSKAPSGVSWAPLSPVTLARRRGGASSTSKRGRELAAVRAAKGLGPGGAKPLLDTGRLSNSISYRVGDMYVEVGTNVVQARMQQEGARQGAFGRTRRGAPIPWGNVPPRPFLGLSDADRAMVIQVFNQALEQVRRFPVAA